MAFKNTATSYGLIAKIFHWATALLILLSYTSVYYRRWFTEVKTSENWNVLQLHLSIGITIGVIVLLRIVWKMSNPTPKLEPGTRIEHMAAHTGHFALYIMMIVMVITGYFGTGANTEYFSLFDIPKFEDTALFQSLVTGYFDMTFKEFEKPMDFIHKDVFGSWLVWILILGHVLAALYHTYVKKDQTLYKMLGK